MQQIDQFNVNFLVLKITKKQDISANKWYLPSESGNGDMNDKWNILSYSQLSGIQAFINLLLWRCTILSHSDLQV